jgi:hypothetical protein
MIIDSTITKYAISFGTAALFALCVTAPTNAAPVLSNTAALKSATDNSVVDVRWWRRGSWGWGRGAGAAVIGGLALGASAARSSYYYGYPYYGYGYGPYSSYYGYPYSRSYYGYGYAPYSSGYYGYHYR